MKIKELPSSYEFKRPNITIFAAKYVNQKIKREKSYIIIVLK
jgi:hypothetical protein